MSLICPLVVGCRNSDILPVLYVTSLCRSFTSSQVLPTSCLSNWRKRYWSMMCQRHILTTFMVISLLPSLVGGGQSCSCSVSRNRLSFPVPKGIICPTGPWKHISHVLGRWTCPVWNAHVLFLCHVACAGNLHWIGHWKPAKCLTCSALQDRFIDRIILSIIYNHPIGQLVTLYHLCLVSCTMECKQEQHLALASKNVQNKSCLCISALCAGPLVNSQRTFKSILNFVTN